VSSISSGKSAYYMIKVLLAIFIGLVRERFEDAARAGEAPVLVTSSGIRPFVRGIIERFRAQTPVMSQAEIHPRARLKTVGNI